MSRLRRLLAFGIVMTALAGSAPAQELREGLVVIEAPSTGSLEQAGLEQGDILLSWQRGNASGLLRWPHGLAEAETEQAPWGVVRLTGWRAGEPMTWQMPPVRWNVRTRPALSPYLLTLYEEGARKAAAREPEAAAESWLAAVDAATRAGDQPRAAWFLGELGRAQAAAFQWEKADLTYESAIGRVEGGGMAAYLLREWGATFIRRGLWARAEDSYQRALALAPQGSLSSSRDLALLATIATHRGDLDKAERLYKQALVARQRVTIVSTYLSRLMQEEIAGFGIPYQGVSLEEIKELRHKLEGLREKLLALAGVPPAKGAGAPARTAAAPPQKLEKKLEPSRLETLQKALAKAEREAPGSLAVSDAWQELGAYAFEIIDPVGAEIAWLHALEIREKLAPGTTREARTLHDLGQAHRKAGRYRAASSFYCRAAASLDRIVWTPPGISALWDALGERPEVYDEHCVNALIDAHRTDEAFLALERSHLRDSAPPLTADLLSRFRKIDTDRGQALTRLSRLSTSRDRDEVDLLDSYSEELAAERSTISGPRGLDALREALPPGALLLAWSIGNERSFLFLVRPAGSPEPGIEVLPVRAMAPDLRESVRTFGKNAAAVPRTAADLYRKLFQPADEQVAKADKLLLLPGEILASLPFGALLRGDSPLAQQKPLETATSVTAWAALQEVLRGGKDTQDAKGSP